MPHVIERAASGRSRCRACGERIAKEGLRLGERLPNPFGDGEMTLWFHVACGAYARPEAFLEAIAQDLPEAVPDGEQLQREAQRGLEHRRLPRLRGVERAPSGRARCRSCREPIEKNAWRLPLQYYEEGQFSPSGFIHVRCAGAYFETVAIIERLRHYAPGLEDAALAEIDAELGSTNDEPGD